MNYSKLFLFIFLLIGISIFSQENVQKYSKAKIYYSSSSDLELLSYNGLAVDHGLIKKNMFIESVFSEKEIETARRLGFKVNVVIDDMQKHVTNLKREAAEIQNSLCTNTSKL